MPSFCAIATCNDRYGHSENISFHKFPLKKFTLLKQWEAFIQKQRGEDWHASRWSSLCSRHFREDDFRSLNERRTLKKTAVPSILLDKEKKVSGSRKSKRKKNEKVVNTIEDTREKEFNEILAIKERLEDTAINATSTILNLPKSNCRLCGLLSHPSANFLDNFELYGLLQKCFPTINIQQEDALPKDICAFCHKHLEEFGSFVDLVWTAQTELHRKFRTKAVEKPVKIKQEPLVRVKQEVAENGYDDRQDTSGFGGINEDYDGATDGGVHEDGDDQKFAFCDFPIINDCDIMEIINLDDPFINIPDDDNTTTEHEEEELLQKPIYETLLNYMPTAHELLQSHLLLEEHNYANVDAEDFKEERQIYKTEKSDNDERPIEYITANDQEQQTLQLHTTSYNIDTRSDEQYQNAQFAEQTTTDAQKIAFENRALKPIVTSVSAIQQPIKSSSNSIVVLNESIVTSGSGFQLHACMVCHLKYFSVESLKQHYTQAHGPPMVTVPGENIPLEKVTQRACKMEKEFTEIAIENRQQDFNTDFNERELSTEINSLQSEKENNLKETKIEEPDTFVEKQSKTDSSNGGIKTQNVELLTNNPTQLEQNVLNSQHATEGPEVLQAEKTPTNETLTVPTFKNRKFKLKIPIKARKSQSVSLNTMANQYQQLRKLYQKLQKKCTSLEQNVEQLQLLPTTPSTIKAKSKTKVIKKSSLAKVLNAVKPNDNLANKVITKKVDFSCTECSKIFTNSNSLRQHKITHTEERKHHCSLCQRSFKRRNGLLQHLKGFHLQVKPFSCPVCNHSYALKCDMLRCKHSTLRNMKTSEKINKSRVILKNLEK